MSKLYEEIGNKLINAIYNKDFGTNKLPTERELCEIYKVSRQTIRKALEYCESTGLINKRQGSGIYLSSSFQKSVNRCALIIPDKEEYIYPELIHSLDRLLFNVNFSLDVYESYDSQIKEGIILNELLKHPVNTIIIMSSRNNLPTPNSNLYSELLSSHTKILFIGNPYANLSNYSYIKFDDFFSGYSIASRITSNEQNWCAIFASDDRSNTDRYYGFIQYMAENGYEYNENNIHWITHSDLMNIRYENNISCIRNILDGSEQTPSILICGQDEIAYSSIVHLKNTRKLTDETTVFSFYSSYLQNLLDFPVHSYEGDKSLLFSKIVEYVINEDKKKKEVITLPSSLKY